MLAPRPSAGCRAGQGPPQHATVAPQLQTAARTAQPNAPAVLSTAMQPLSHAPAALPSSTANIAALPANVQSMLSAALQNPADSSNALSMLMQQRAPAPRPPSGDPASPLTLAAHALPAINAPQPFSRSPAAAAAPPQQPPLSAIGGVAATLGHASAHLPGHMAGPMQPGTSLPYPTAPALLSGGAAPGMPPADPEAMLRMLQQHQMHGMLGPGQVVQPNAALPHSMPHSMPQPGMAPPPLQGQPGQVPFGTYHVGGAAYHLPGHRDSTGYSQPGNPGGHRGSRG